MAPYLWIQYEMISCRGGSELSWSATLEPDFSLSTVIIERSLLLYGRSRIWLPGRTNTPSESNWGETAANLHLQIMKLGTLNRRFRLTTLTTFRTLWGVKEPTHYLQRVGHGDSGVVVCSLSQIVVWGNKCLEILPTPTYSKKIWGWIKQTLFYYANHIRLARVSLEHSQKEPISDISIQLRDFNHWVTGHSCVGLKVVGLSRFTHLVLKQISALKYKTCVIHNSALEERAVVGWREGPGKFETIGSEQKTLNAFVSRLRTLITRTECSENQLEAERSLT